MQAPWFALFGCVCSCSSTWQHDAVDTYHAGMRHRGAADTRSLCGLVTAAVLAPNQMACDQVVQRVIHRPAAAALQYALVMRCRGASAGCVQREQRPSGCGCRCSVVSVSLPSQQHLVWCWGAGQSPVNIGVVFIDHHVKDILSHMGKLHLGWS
jgi:hypothetical protein